MHEMGVAQQIINIAIASIPEEIINPKVETINLKVGKLAAVVEDSLQFCFEILSKDTLLSGAKLVINHVPVKIRCKDCNNVWEVDGAVFSCPSCKDGGVEVISGRELEIVSIEIEEE